MINQPTPRHFVELPNEDLDEDGTFWRYESSITNYENGHNKAHVYPREFTGMRETPKGLWVLSAHAIECGVNEKMHLIRHDHKKKFAYPTQAEAFQAWKYRLRKREEHWNTEGRRINALKQAIAE